MEVAFTEQLFISADLNTEFQFSHGNLRRGHHCSHFTDEKTKAKDDCAKSMHVVRPFGICSITFRKFVLINIATSSESPLALAEFTF